MRYVALIPLLKLAKSLSQREGLAPNHIYLSFYLFQNIFICHLVVLYILSAIFIFQTRFLSFLKTGTTSYSILSHLSL